MVNVLYRSNYVQKLKPDRESMRFSEYKLAVIGFVISLTVLGSKLLYANRNAIRNLLFEDKLMSYETVEANGQIMLHYIRSTVLRFNSLLISLFCGIFMSAFTWLIVYLDSAVPGVYPPTPFSPSKLKRRSGHTFHLGYVIAILNGVLVFTLMYFNGN